MQKKKVDESLTVMTQIVLPNDTNPLGNLFGGQLLAWMDLASSVASKRHSEGIVVTASVNNVTFSVPIHLGSVVTLEAKVTRAFTTSMEIFVDVWVEGPSGKTRFKANTAIYIFAAVDENGKKRPVPELVPETEEEIKRFQGALRRREMSLILAGKLKPKQATELRALFE
ncbi:MAG: acyl-CoA thioesterase [Flavobacteriales bacterium]|nr:acyl-CoA thioesterase [Flavobacteriales bacterium]